jgi:hypothetical protein
MSNIVYPNGRVEVAVAASDKVAVFSEGSVTLSQEVGYPNVPSTVDVLAEVASGLYTTAAFSAAATVIIEAGAAPVYYEVGTDAVVKARKGEVYQGDPVALNATGAVTAAAILGGIVTSTTAAAVAGTIPTGAVMDASSSFAVGDSIDWSVITTGANAFTVTAAASGHTVVGNMVVAAGKAGRFRTRKTAADTFVTYSLSNT